MWQTLQCSNSIRVVQQCIGLLIAWPALLFATELVPQVRRPVALALVDSESHLLVANHHSGTLSAVDLRSRKVVGETRVGRSLSAFIVGQKRAIGVALDDTDSCLITGKVRGHSFYPQGKTAVGHTPVHVLLSADERRAFVASLWARQTTIVDVTTSCKPRVLATIDLPFSPLLQILLPDPRYLVVAGAFGGELALLDIETGRLLQVHRLEGNNLRGLAVSTDRQSLYVAHQILNDYPATTRGGVHWGGVLVNVIRDVKIARLHAVPPSTSPAGDLVYLGHPDRAAGDPAGLIVSNDGRQILAFAGVSEIAISDREADYFRRVAVGRRPAALMLGTKGRTIYVANMMDDSVSIVPIDASSDVRSIQLGPPRELSLVEQGEQLFYDATLSSDGWLSCHSCHTDGHTNGRLNDNFGDGSVGAPKRVLSLLGVGATGPWSWSGKVVRLEEQVRKSIRTTMRGEEPTHAQVAALAAYLRTLSPPPSLSSARQRQPGETVARGARVFRQQGCADCHQPNRFTSPEIYDVGLQDRFGNRRFNPPSLLGVSQRSALFHDGRAASVRDVLMGHRHGIAQDVSQTEIEELIDYLNSL
ncbi:MAG: hypothetical protein CMJ70_13675 [Planctomycetaceae bacterium]|nr:hypothetical protein [Planctomycetaceae bacterium]HAA71644.1 hypothetical protein [Planctomycetaceae bacterium]|tara:strand:- start:320 stop:2083 length:1764 start_codon:yes stop_codon:yes gene_type:complete